MIVDFGILIWEKMTPQQLEERLIDFAVSPLFRNSGLDPSCSFTSPVRFR
jgi:hypothetical protein